MVLEHKPFSMWRWRCLALKTCLSRMGNRSLNYISIRNSILMVKYYILWISVKDMIWCASLIRPHPPRLYHLLFFFLFLRPGKYLKNQIYLNIFSGIEEFFIAYIWAIVTLAISSVIVAVMALLVIVISCKRCPNTGKNYCVSARH